jgi:hypothetical protein
MPIVVRTGNSIYEAYRWARAMDSLGITVVSVCRDYVDQYNVFGQGEFSNPDAVDVEYESQGSTVR